MKYKKRHVQVHNVRKIHTGLHIVSRQTHTNSHFNSSTFEKKVQQTSTFCTATAYIQKVLNYCYIEFLLWDQKADRSGTPSWKMSCCPTFLLCHHITVTCSSPEQQRAEPVISRLLHPCRLWWGETTTSAPLWPACSHYSSASPDNSTVSHERRDIWVAPTVSIPTFVQLPKGPPNPPGESLLYREWNSPPVPYIHHCSASNGTVVQHTFTSDS